MFILDALLISITSRRVHFHQYSYFFYKCICLTQTFQIIRLLINASNILDSRGNDFGMSDKIIQKKNVNLIKTFIGHAW